VEVECPPAGGVAPNAAIGKDARDATGARRNSGGSNGNASAGMVAEGDSNGCGCALAGSDGRGIGGGIASILVLGELVLTGRRERAR
jgi:hypothetical protein